MKILTTTLTAVLLSLSLAGCALLGGPVAEKVAGVIDKYCEEPQRARELYRETINAELAAEGHSILVVCSGDTPPG